MAPLTSIRLPDDFEASRYVEIVDQLRLPHDIVWQKVSTPDQAFDAIKSMKIRGAPAIASLAALSIACNLLDQLASASSAPALSSLPSLQAHVLSLSDRLVKARPTAVNLREALSRIVASSRSQPSSASTSDVARRVVETCKTVWSEDVERNHAIGDHGASWFLSQTSPSSSSPPDDGKGKLSILTVCNTGSLATSGYGTALGVITSLFHQNRLSCVYYMATSPYLQGSRLTSLELKSLGIPSKLVSDTAAAWLISTGRVDGFVCGADRVAANGDTANKISTYQLALLCRHAAPRGKKVPVAVAAPVTTLDLGMETGEGIVIEHRPAIEACTVRGKVVAEEGGNGGGSGGTATVLVTPEGVDAVNPAFDVTPAELIDGIVTELGVASKPPSSSSFDLRSFVDAGQKRGGVGQVAEGKGTVDFGALGGEVERVRGKYAAGNAAFLKNTGHGHPLQSPAAEEGSEGGHRSLGDIAAKKGVVDFDALRGERDRVQAKYAAGNAAYLKNTGRDLASDIADPSR